jgi:prepilin-type N-terminal cleavage/methylation domain-containing protein/prepilin-type processing-associated H-X9-DG protein
LKRSTSERPGAAVVARTACNRRAFTLIELIVVIAIVAILAALLLPGLANAKATARKAKCLSNLRQLAIAAQVFVDNHEDAFPKAYWLTNEQGVNISYAWDLMTIVSDPTRVVPGVLWEGNGSGEIQQCPSYKGGANWLVDPFTGYNYNTSFIGDGEYSGGANKFMRAPFPNPGDAAFTGRWSGTQGFRHARQSNASFADGHVESLQARFTKNQDGEANVGAGTGFLSESNSLYDLD